MSKCHVGNHMSRLIRSASVSADMRFVALIHKTEAWALGVVISSHLLTALMLGHRNGPHIAVYHNCSHGSTLLNFTGPRSAVSNLSGYRCVSDCRSRGREFDPGLVPYFRGD